MNVVTHPWPEIVAFYRRLIAEPGWSGQQPILELVEQLVASPYALGLFGSTSHARLLIGQHADFALGQEILVVEFSQIEQLFEFSYSAFAYEKPHWQAVAAPAEGFSKLEHFLRMQKWFVEYGAANQ